MLKKIRNGLVFAVLVLGWVNFIQAKQDENGDLQGVISKEQLLRAPYASWYTESDRTYRVDQTAIADLEALLDGVNVKIIMGTWCHDSKREVPRFYKILSAVGADQELAEMIAVDRNKKVNTGELDGLGLTNTPTFIFYKDGVELNRIVETPVESLEKDMIRILSGEDYRHSKMPTE